MYIQEEPSERERGIPPDYRGHTYKTPEKVPERVEFSTEESTVPPDPPVEEDVMSEQESQKEKSTPAGAFCFTFNYVFSPQRERDQKTTYRLYKRKNSRCSRNRHRSLWVFHRIAKGSGQKPVAAA